MGGRFRQLFAKTALIKFRNETAFELIAFVEKGQTKCENGSKENRGLVNVDFS